MSLRARLVAGVLVLATLVLVGADVATYVSLRSFLFDRVDSSLDATHQAVEQALRQSPQDAAAAIGAAQDAAGGAYVQLRAPSGRVVWTTAGGGGPPGGPAAPAPSLPTAIRLQRTAASGPDLVGYFTVGAVRGGGRYRVRASIDPQQTATLIVASSLVEVDSTLRRLIVIELVVTALGLVAIAVLGLWIVRIGLRPLDSISRTADTIAAGDLSRRVERAEPRTEVGRLGLALNTMLGHIETAFEERAASEERLRRSEERLRRFVADASHELRTPLAAVRAYAELFRRGADRRPEDLARAMNGIERESARMGVLVQDLLLLAQLDEGRPLARDPVRLDELSREAAEAARAVDPERALELQAVPIVVHGDRERLRQVLDNLLGNVRAHTPAGSPAVVRVLRTDAEAVVEVEDAGPGLQPDEAERIFERFYRSDPSRSRARGGVGLGLSIVAAVAEAHGGTAAARPADGGGTVFRLTLPLDDERADQV
jgi:two-component system OmpR family sensor kinase